MKKIGPYLLRAYEKLRSEKSSTGGYLILLLGYARSPVRYFESCLRNVVGLNDDDIQLILTQNISFFSINYKKTPGIFTIKNLLEVVYTMGDLQKTVQIEYDFTMKTKLILTRS